MSYANQLQAKAISAKEADNLLLQIAAGSTAALQALYQQLAEGIYGFALSITKSTYDAEDVLQDTFVAVYQKAATYRTQGKPTAWIYTIAKHLALEKLRQNQKALPAEDTILDRQPDFAQIEQTENRLALQAAMQILSPEERQILLLHAAGGLKNREIARVLELPLGTVLSKYHRSLKKLEHFLKEESL